MKSIAKKILSKKDIATIKEIAEKYNVTVEKLGNHLDCLDKTQETKRECFTVSLTRCEYNDLCERYEENFTKNKSNIIRLCFIKAVETGMIEKELVEKKLRLETALLTEKEEEKKPYTLSKDGKTGRGENLIYCSINVAFGKKNLRDLYELKRIAMSNYIRPSIILKWCLLNVEL